ncbi:MAG: hypothetical protein LLG16_03885 [Euryarchaeota archaeon]|nr:hypothetical protein [Euryarchaeota archaeon]
MDTITSNADKVISIIQEAGIAGISQESIESRALQQDVPIDRCRNIISNKLRDGEIVKSFVGPNRAEIYTIAAESERAWGKKPGYESITDREVRDAAYEEVKKYLAAKNDSKDLPETPEPDVQPKDGPVNKSDNKCQYCRRKLTSAGRVLKHESSCPKNPANKSSEEDPKAEDDRPEDIPCPVEGCVTNIKNYRWNVVIHLSKGHPEIPKDERKAIVDRLFPETKGEMVKGLAERIDAGGKALEDLKDKVAQVEAQRDLHETDCPQRPCNRLCESVPVDPDPPAAPPIEELVLPFDVKDDAPVRKSLDELCGECIHLHITPATDVDPAEVDCLFGCDPQTCTDYEHIKSNAVHRETVIVPDYPPLIDSTLDHQKEEYHIHDEDDVVIRKDLDEHIGMIETGPVDCPSLFSALSRELVQLSGMAEGKGYEIVQGSLEEEDGTMHLAISVKKKVSA